MSSSEAIVISSEASPTGIDKIPVVAQHGEERVVHIGRNGEKERGERASSSNARWHNPPLIDDEGVEGTAVKGVTKLPQCQTRARERKGMSISVGTPTGVLARAIVVAL